MRNVSPSLISLCLNSYRQIAELTVYGANETFLLTDGDIIQGGLTVNRRCITGTSVEIGSAVASELTLILNNATGKFDDVLFDGAEIYVRIGIKNWNSTDAPIQYLPLGYFTVDETPRKLAQITLCALDRMARFDKEVDAALATLFPMTVSRLLDVISGECGVTPATSFATLTNAELMVQELPTTEGLTYRRLLQWCAELTGTCAYIDEDGKLRLEFYEGNIYNITPAERYTSDLYEYKTTITGIRVATNTEEYMTGQDGYRLNVEGNLLLRENTEAVALALDEKLNGFSYTPYSCTVKPMPYLFPMDRILYRDKNGTEYSTVVTDMTYRMNNGTEVAGQGESVTKTSAATADGLTAYERYIINKATTRLDKDFTDRQQAVLDLNQTIGNALGLHITEEMTDGRVQYYYHDAVSRAESSVIYTLNAGGFAWTDEWNDGEPVWHYGVTKDGNAILNYLSVNKLSASQIEVSSIVTAINGDNTLTLSAGSINLNGYISANGTFMLDPAGNLKTTSGEIGGYTIGETRLTAKNVGMCSTDGVEWAFWAGADTGAEAPFHVGHNGTLYASDAIISGSVTATSGTIGGCTIENNVLKVDSANIESLSVEKLSAGTKGNFTLDDNGNATLNSLQAKNAYIEGEAIIDGTLRGYVTTGNASDTGIGIVLNDLGICMTQGNGTGWVIHMIDGNLYAVPARYKAGEWTLYTENKVLLATWSDNSGGTSGGNGGSFTGGGGSRFTPAIITLT